MQFSGLPTPFDILLPSTLYMRGSCMAKNTTYNESTHTSTVLIHLFSYCFRLYKYNRGRHNCFVSCVYHYVFSLFVLMGYSRSVKDLIAVKFAPHILLLRATLIQSTTLNKFIESSLSSHAGRQQFRPRSSFFHLNKICHPYQITFSPKTK